VLLAADEWIGSARGSQYRPGMVGDTWLVVGGRGSGKTRLGAEWVTALANGYAPFGRRGQECMRIALVGETLGDVREVMVEGASGIASIARHERPRFEATRRRLLFSSGAVAQCFSSEDPDSLRGPQFEAAWSDELAKWKNAQECFDMLQFGLRLGAKPRQLITTTPRPTPLVRRLVADVSVTVTRMRTSDNAANLAAGFIGVIEERYGGTRLGRQELEGELIEDREDALWTREALETAAAGGFDAASLERIVVAVDPPATSRRSSDACGIVVAGRAADGTVLVLHDGSVRAARPIEWASRVVALHRRFDADAVVAEVNQGGDMVAAVIATVDPDVAVREVRANRGKWLRAEPVAALYSKGRVRHAARFPELEDEMCSFGPDGLADGRSPDRLDALVWAVAALTQGRDGKPRIRDL
jgi:phage terminase large subunit-like protein